MQAAFNSSPRVKSGLNLELIYLADGIPTAEWIRHAQRTFRIIAPFPIHHKPIIVSAVLQSDYGAPQTVGNFPQVDRLLLPICKASHELHGFRGWRVK